MTRALRWIGVLGALSLVTVAGIGLAQNAKQEGSGTTCADFNALSVIPQASAAQLTDNVVVVEAGTGFQVSSDTGTVHVDFFNNDGEWVGFNGGGDTGTVPSGADYATICVGLTGLWPDAPVPVAEWTYQDGF